MAFYAPAALDTGAGEVSALDAGNAGTRSVKQVPPSSADKRADDDISTEVGSSIDSEGELGEDDQEEALCIFDWDDTLFPTTWVQQQRLLTGPVPVVNDEQRAKLDLLAESAAQVLIEASRYGRVVIVTNAEKGWVEFGCDQLMPSLRSSLPEGIISARSDYQMRTPCATEWKRHAFRSEADSFYGEASGRRRNIISVGDSLHERMALVATTVGLPNCLAKSVKFAGQPQVEQLVEAHDSLRRSFADIASHDGNLDLSFETPMQAEKGLNGGARSHPYR